MIVAIKKALKEWYSLKARRNKTRQMVKMLISTGVIRKA